MSEIVWSDGETIENGIINDGKAGLNTSVVTDCLLPTDEKFHYALCKVHCDAII
jgi:hypothetical protein